MKFSIITITHLKNAFLEELHETLVSQTHTNWEWILYLNGGAQPNQLPKSIIDDTRVRVYVDSSGNSRVGYLKNKAFHYGTGDVLVEMDHDDLLTPNCLEKLEEAYKANPDVGFVYSNNATWHIEDKFVPYNKVFGWEYTMFNWRGKELYAMTSFPPTSRSVMYIWYGPDHVRSWRREVYVELGGHNVDLEICDDQELMIRTYLNSKMYHVNEVLYIYRVTGKNTWIERNQAIQDKTVEIGQQYAWDLAVRESRLRGLNVVELGGGINPKNGCDINIDLEDGNVKADLNDGIPLEDNSAGVIYASHILEHLHDKHKIMCEIHRVLADGGWAFIQVPSTDGRGAFQDPTHVSYWNENCFWYYTRGDKAAFIRNDTIKFQAFKLNTFFWEPRSDNIAITDAWLVAIKSDERRPHLRAI